MTGFGLGRIGLGYVSGVSFDFLKDEGSINRSMVKSLLWVYVLLFGYSTEFFFFRPKVTSALCRSIGL